MNASKGAAMKKLVLALSAAGFVFVAIIAAPAILGDAGGAESAGPVPSAFTDRPSRTVDGVPFSFSAPTPGWEPGPIERLPDGGFGHGSLLISKSTVCPQGAEAIVFWTSFPDGDDA